MGFLNLNLYGHPSEVAFDPCKVIAKAKEWFPEAQFVPGDQATEEVSRVQANFAEALRNAPTGPESKVVASLRRKAESYGPNYAFTIPMSTGQSIRGLARSVEVSFLFEKPLPSETRQRLVAFLTSLGVGFLRASTDDERQTELLSDLHGPSDCLRDQPGVPWKRAGDFQSALGAEAP
jgi:hypothetical protein